ncbi:PucR family transcriptional regulator [Nocardia sp. NPDC020380]|uniref:PucR family transcriptional regulator n=1 Tax=Nocardia sp. NPDC020380 TaxID=3364309 RepID=UPI003787E497
MGRTAHLKDLWAARGGAGSEPLCTVVLHHPGELSGSDQRILERAALVTALLLLFRRSIAEAEGRVRGELLDDLLGGRVPDREALQTRAGLLGVDLTRAHVLVVIDHAKHPRAATWATGYALARHGLAATRGDHVVLLLPGTDATITARHVWREIGLSLAISATVAGSGPVDLPARAPDAYREAGSCVQALHALGKHGTAAGVDSLDFAGLLLSRETDVIAFLRTTLGRGIDYDHRRNTLLLPTLDAYFETGCSLSHSAKRLHIHVNTVSQRLERITALLGEGWQHPNRALEIQLALRIHRLRQANVFTG